MSPEASRWVDRSDPDEIVIGRGGDVAQRAQESQPGFFDGYIKRVRSKHEPVLPDFLEDEAQRGQIQAGRVGHQIRVSL